MRAWVVDVLLTIAVLAFLAFLLGEPAKADPPLYTAPGPVPVQPPSPPVVRAPQAPGPAPPVLVSPGDPVKPIIKMDPAFDYLDEVGLDEDELLGIDPDFEYGIGDDGWTQYE